MSSLRILLVISVIACSLPLETNLIKQEKEKVRIEELGDKKREGLVETLGQEKNIGEKKFKYFIFEEKCFEMFFVKKDLLNFPCLKLTLSKFIGYGLVYGSLVVKAPQIMKILMNCSILGISFSSIVIEAIMYFMMMGYNIHKGYPFSIYGENVFLGVSNIFIMACFFVFCKEKKYSTYIKGTLLLFGISIPLIFQLAPNFIIQNSLWLGMIAFMMSRYEQIRQNAKNKSTGNLSFLTTFLNLGGNIARSFTILTQASGDMLYLLSNVIPILVNGFIMIQFFMYWNNQLVYDGVSEMRKRKDSNQMYSLTKSVI